MSAFLNDTLEDRRVGVLESKILRTLLYFDIFHHPMRFAEIHQYLHGLADDKDSLRKSLDRLVSLGLIHSGEGFYSLRKVEVLSRRRLDGEAQAMRALKTAKKYSSIIASFPFVRGVCISGSLSKGYMDARTDIDYFVITHPGRLWLSRTLLVLFKKVILFNSKKHFCVNYFISADNLRIPDQNIFTATEAASLIPMYNPSLYSQLLAANPWIKLFFPQLLLREPDCVQARTPVMKRNLERLFRGQVGERLDAACFRLTLKFWKRKFRNFDEATFDLRLRSRRNVSKHHPHGFQEKVLKAYDSQIRRFEDLHALSLR